MPDVLIIEGVKFNFKFIVGLNPPSNHPVRSGPARLCEYLAVLQAIGNQQALVLQGQGTLRRRGEQGAEPAFPCTENDPGALRGGDQAGRVAHPQAPCQGRVGQRAAIDLVRSPGYPGIRRQAALGGHHRPDLGGRRRHEIKPAQTPAKVLAALRTVPPDGNVAARRAGIPALRRGRNQGDDLSAH